MSTAATRQQEYTPSEGPLYLSFELSNNTWKLASSPGSAHRPRLKAVKAGNLAGVLAEVSAAKKRFGLDSTSRVLSCFEAGRDGFWIHRFLVQSGIENMVVDSSSIEVSRRCRRAKSDRLDAIKLVSMLIRWASGEKKVWSVVRVPTVEQEDQRQLHRELRRLKQERTRLTNRMKGLLVSQGVRLPVKRDFISRLHEARLWDESPVPCGLRGRLERDYAKVELINHQIKELESERERLLRESKRPPIRQIRQLIGLRGVGPCSSWLLVMEVFAWRSIKNRKELASLIGLTPTPYNSGDAQREQGISKSGNRYVRWMSIELAWSWLRFQPQSRLSLWYQERFGHGSSRMRRIGVVALARKLVIALWRYLETGEVPEGAILST